MISVSFTNKDKKHYFITKLLAESRNKKKYGKLTLEYMKLYSWDINLKVL